jgi:hypothetical protein
MSEAGATTAEYAVGTVGAAGIAAVLMNMGVATWLAELLSEIIRASLDPGLLLDHLRSTWLHR